MATEKQIEANRRNAALSTGPKTIEGKAQSRANAITHGLTSVTLLPHDQKDVSKARYAAWYACLKPEDTFQEFHLELAVQASLRIENCQNRELERKVELAEIASDSGPKWETDRKREVVKLARSLKRNPEMIALQLRSMPTGREWLIDRWKFLLMAVAEGQTSSWRVAESNLALDLMGKPGLLRDLLLERANPFVDSTTTRALILKEIAGLEAEQEDDEREDIKLRSLHIRGLIFETDSSLTLIRRYETSAQRQFDKALKSIRNAKSVATVNPQSKQRGPANPSVCDTNPISASPKTQVVAQETTPEYETKPIAPIVASQIRSSDRLIQVTQPEGLTPKPAGNRLYRRQQQKQVRHQAYLNRIAG